MKEIIVLGAGGHAKSVIDVIELHNEYKIAGIVDNNLEKGTIFLDYKVIGNDSDLESLREKYEYAIIAVGQIKTPDIRIKLFKKLKELNFMLPVIISPIAYVSKRAKIEEGTIIMHHSLINTDAKIGKNCIINSKALIEHDAVIEDFCHISTGAIVNGGTTVREKTFFGSNATSKEYIDVSGFIKAGSLAK
jgi:sugar O-acyltransferase (sialic acid O-acetyltransferase NeuD family)